MRREDTKYFLEEKDLPKFWYNVQADMPNPIEPHLHPITLKPLLASDMEPLFAKALVEQEMSMERYIEIPKPVLDIYAQYRPTPLVRARSLEKALDTNCQIYYKYEGASPVGSHKLNSALPQAFYNHAEGIKRLTTETGAGQWGTALSLACTHFSLELLVYMVRSSYEQKPYRRSVIELYGNKVIPSPSNTTAAGRKVLAETPDTPGSLGDAISEAVEDAMNREDTHYSLGSVLNHVCLHQTVIGQEIRTQLELLDLQPDVMVGACGGGSNFAGTIFPFIPDVIKGKKIKLLGVEPAACPSMTQGVFAYDYGDSVGLAPVVKMYTLGHNYTPPGIHAGGLRYHGEAPLLSQLYHDGLIEAKSVKQNESFAAAVLFARTESIVLAPEASHTIRATIDEALAAKAAGESKVIVCTISGHGLLDLFAYDRYLSGEIQDVEFSKAAMQKSLAELPKV